MLLNLVYIISETSLEKIRFFPLASSCQLKRTSSVAMDAIVHFILSGLGPCVREPVKTLWMMPQRF